MTLAELIDVLQQTFGVDNMGRIDICRVDVTAEADRRIAVDRARGALDYLAPFRSNGKGERALLERLFRAADDDSPAAAAP